MPAGAANVIEGKLNNYVDDINKNQTLIQIISWVTMFQSSINP